MGRAGLMPSAQNLANGSRSNTQGQIDQCKIGDRGQLFRQAAPRGLKEIAADDDEERGQDAWPRR